MLQINIENSIHEFFNYRAWPPFTIVCCKRDGLLTFYKSTPCDNLLLAPKMISPFIIYFIWTSSDRTPDCTTDSRRYYSTIFSSVNSFVCFGFLTCLRNKETFFGDSFSSVAIGLLYCLKCLGVGSSRSDRKKSLWFFTCSKKLSLFVIDSQTARSTFSCYSCSLSTLIRSSLS